MEIVALAQLMYILGLESKYNSELYHYLLKYIDDPIPCEVGDLKLSVLTKHEFGLLKQIDFEDEELQYLIEVEKERRRK